MVGEEWEMVCKWCKSGRGRMPPAGGRMPPVNLFFVLQVDAAALLLQMTPPPPHQESRMMAPFFFYGGCRGLAE